MNIRRAQDGIPRIARRGVAFMEWIDRINEALQYDLVDDSFQPFLKLALIFRSSHESSHIEGIEHLTL